MISIKKLGHVVLWAKDLERSTRFYRDILGFKEVARLHGSMVFFTIDGTNHHDLAIAESRQTSLGGMNATKGSGLYHLAFKIGDLIEDLRGAKEWLEQNGVILAGAADHTVSQSLYLLDPDGNEIELYVDSDPTIWKENPRAVASSEPLRL